MIHLISDPHLNCKNLVANTRPQFGSMDEHDAWVIDAINSRVNRKDTLVLSGDLCFGRPSKWRHKILCKQIRFVLGNHDKEAQCKAAFGTVWHYLTMKIPQGKMWISHYPTAFWDGYHKGYFHMYGHTHAEHEEWLDRIFPGRRAMDIGIDNAFRLLGEYRPFSLDEVMQFIGDRPGHYYPKDRWSNKDFS